MAKTDVKSKNGWRYVISITLWAFTISAVLSLIASHSLGSITYITAGIVLLIFIFLGVFFDIIGVAVTTVDEIPYHSMSARKVRGAKESVWLSRNASKVSSFCNDVVGDISGIISGSTGAVVVVRLAKNLSGQEVLIQCIMTGVISALTIGGKAFGKRLALKRNHEIVFLVGKFISFLHWPPRKGGKK